MKQRSIGRSRRLRSSSTTDLWEEIARAAGHESPLWSESLRTPDERELGAVFSPLGEGRFALGIETIYEGYLAHYGRSRLFAPDDGDTALLLGDYLYAHGLVRIADVGSAEAVRDLAELISVCAHLQASPLGDGSTRDGAAWAATAALLGRGELDAARTALRDDGDPMELLTLAAEQAGAVAVERALAAHAALLR